MKWSGGSAGPGAGKSATRQLFSCGCLREEPGIKTGHRPARRRVKRKRPSEDGLYQRHSSGLGFGLGGELGLDGRPLAFDLFGATVFFDGFVILFAHNILYFIRRWRFGIHLI